MKIEVINSQENELEFKINGEDDTFGNLLRKMLHEDEHVQFAAYRINHPLIEKEKPVFKVKTDGKESPRDALERAAERAKELAKNFRENFNAV